MSLDQSMGRRTGQSLTVGSDSFVDLTLKQRILNLRCALKGERLPWQELWFSFFPFGANTTDDLVALGTQSADQFLELIKSGIQSREPVYLANFAPSGLVGDSAAYSCYLVPEPRFDFPDDVKDTLDFCTQMISGVAHSSVGIILGDADLDLDSHWMVFEKLVLALGKKTPLETITFLAPSARYLPLINRMAALRENVHNLQKEFVCEIYH